MPWVAETEKEFIKVITSTPVQFPKKILLSLNVKDFILKCLAVD
jgi:5'-AMP-activated protein kinase catalytic alpha subunit/serine/threonine-protein kinase ULK/ATG1/calcium-dependent protein kinase